MTLHTITGMTLNDRLSPGDVRAYDIGWALHHINLYRGHTSVPWDILSHTGLAYMLYVQDLKGKTEVPFSLALLLYNAHAYVGGAASMESRADTTDAIFKRFNVPQMPGELPWDLVERYDDQATAIAFHGLYPALRDTPHAPPLEYPVDKYPVLIKARVNDYVTLLKHLSINHGVEDIDTLFALPDSLRPYLEESPKASESKSVLEVRETRSIEDLRV